MIKLLLLAGCIGISSLAQSASLTYLGDLTIDNPHLGRPQGVINFRPFDPDLGDLEKIVFDYTIETHATTTFTNTGTTPGIGDVGRTFLWDLSAERNGQVFYIDDSIFNVYDLAISIIDPGEFINIDTDDIINDSRQTLIEFPGFPYDDSPTEFLFVGTSDDSNLAHAPSSWIDFSCMARDGGGEVEGTDFDRISFSLSGQANCNVSLTYEYDAVVSEPTTMWLIAAGGVLGISFRKKVSMID